MSQRIILLCVFLFFINGCNLFSSKQSLPEQLLLLSPKDGPEAVLLKQKVTMDARGEQHQFLVVVRIENTQLKLSALLATGQPLLSLSYDGQVLQQNNASPLALPSEEILAMMQFALWPKTAIEKAYRTENGWQLIFDVGQRQLFTAAGKVVTVYYQSENKMIVENHLHHYRVIIENLEKIRL